MADITDEPQSCPNCGQAVDDGELVCPHCSAPLEPQPADDTCPYCGARTVGGECRVCGLLQPHVDPVASARRWTVMAVGLALVALLGSAWLTRPWDELAAPPTPDARARYANLPGPSATPTVTPTWTATATPTVTPTSTATPTPAFITYVVQRGDTASEIAQRHGITTAELLEANGLTANDVLGTGQELRIPTGSGEPAPTETPEPTQAPTETEAPTAAPTPTTEPSTEPTAEPTPTAEATATPQPTRGQVIHVVREGEHLGVIAPRYGLDQATIARANGISVDSILRPGQELIIPIADGGDAPGAAEPIVHVVQEGDILGRIAVRYGVSVEALAAANGISTNATLRIGQELVIPGTSVQPTETPAPTEIPEPTEEPPSTEATAPDGEPPRAVASVGGGHDEPSPTATATPTRKPTLTPPPRTYAYGEPSLLAPTNGARLEGGAEADVLLSWSSVGVLGEHEWYQLSVWRPMVKGSEVVVWTKATSWRLAPTVYPRDGETHTFWWRVTVVDRSGGDLDPELLSAGSRVYRFLWL